MVVRVIEPSSPIVLPEEIPGAAAGDETVERLIAAVTAVIDGPDGWVGRAFGAQTLELQLASWQGRNLILPYAPIITVDSVTYLDRDHVSQTVNPSVWGVRGGVLWFDDAWPWPCLSSRPLPVSIQYQAGYNGVSVADGGTGKVPEAVRTAIILSVTHLRSMSAENLFLKVDEVEGVGRREFTVSAQAEQIVRDKCDRLLMQYRSYS